MSKSILLILSLSLLATVASAAELTEDEARAEARRTIMRPLSETGGATTTETGLSKNAAALVDLFLDVQRNKRDIRDRRAPRSPHFFGTPHPRMSVEKGRLRLAACFVKLEIARAEMPLATVPVLLETVLDPAKMVQARIASDGADFDRFRRSLVADVLVVCDEELAKDRRRRKAWARLRTRAVTDLLEGMKAGVGHELHGMLNVIARFGDEPAALALIALAENLPAGTPAYQKGTYVGAIARMEFSATRDYARKHLEGPDRSLSIAALNGLARRPDERTLQFIERALAPDSKAHEYVRGAALRAMENLATPRAEKALAGVFEKPRGEREKYSVACALLRMGSRRSRKFLEGKLAEFEAAGEKSPRVSILKDLLAKSAKGKAGR